MSKLLRLTTVLDRTGKSRSGLYRDIAEGDFPSPVRIGERSVAWIENEVDQWIEQRPKARHQQAA